MVTGTFSATLSVTSRMTVPDDDADLSVMVVVDRASWAVVLVVWALRVMVPVNPLMALTVINEVPG